MSLPLLYYPISPDVTAFSTYRSGGCSRGSYASLNVNPYCGDDVQCVQQNLTILSAHLGISPQQIVLPHQTHTTQVAWVTENQPLDDIDAVVTSTPGLCVCVSTADCVPILLYNEQDHMVAAIHAGWRGTVADIVSSTLHTMQVHGCTDFRHTKAVIGPSIGVDAFEVGDEVYEAFQQASFPMQHIAVRRGKWHIDLWKANQWLLEQWGITQIYCAGICTYQQYEQFFSARRLGIRSGRILNGIFIKE